MKRILLIAGLLLVAALIFASCANDGSTSTTVPPTVTVTFNSNGGSEIPQQNVVQGDKISPDSPEKAGYAFAGWTYQGEDWSLSTEINSDITLEAKWEPVFVFSKNTIVGLTEYGRKEEKIIIPEEFDNHPVESIAPKAFEDDTCLKSIVIPNCITFIGSGAFAGCSNLESMTIPFVGSNIDSYEPFGYVFGSSPNESMVEVCQLFPGSNGPERNQEFYIPCNLKSISVTGNISILWYGAFSNFYNLETISLPSTLTQIRYAAFANCINLKNINLPTGISEINDCVFQNCWSLEITIPATVTYISGRAFHNMDQSAYTAINPSGKYGGNPVYGSGSSASITFEDVERWMMVSSPSSFYSLWMAEGGYFEVEYYDFEGKTRTIWYINVSYSGYNVDFFSNGGSAKKSKE